MCGTEVPIEATFDESLYECGAATTPLYEGSEATVLQAVASQLLWFTFHPGTSKELLSRQFEIQHCILPPGNLMPANYSEAYQVIKLYLVDWYIASAVAHVIA